MRYWGIRCRNGSGGSIKWFVLMIYSGGKIYVEYVCLFTQTAAG